MTRIVEVCNFLFDEYLSLHSGFNELGKPSFWWFNKPNNTKLFKYFNSSIIAIHPAAEHCTKSKHGLTESDLLWWFCCCNIFVHLPRTRYLNWWRCWSNLLVTIYAILTFDCILSYTRLNFISCPLPQCNSLLSIHWADRYMLCAGNGTELTEAGTLSPVIIHWYIEL